MSWRDKTNIMDAIILGANYHNTYGIIRSLHKIGVKPIVITPPLSGLCCYKGSRLIKQIFELPTNEVLDFLIRRVKDASEKDTLFVSSDFFANFVDSNSAVLGKFYNIPGASGKLNHYMDKQEMAKLAEACGLNIPPNSTLYKTKELTEHASILNYPCIIKPSKSIAGSKSDIFIAENKTDFVNIIPKLNCESVQLQDYIDKDFEYQLIGLSLPNGQIIIPALTRLIWASSPRTNTGIVRTYPITSANNIPIDSVKRFIHSIGCVGSFSVEFLRDRSGHDFFMEINFRNDGNAIVITYSGVNLHAI